MLARTPTIKELLRQQGTNKWSMYGDLYDVLFAPMRDSLRCVVEIGIGTLDPNAPSTMIGFCEEGYRPGGSLRAWRDYFPNAEIHGIDVHPDTMFEDERIFTHLIDSTVIDIDSTVCVDDWATLPGLIIDDGLHSIGAQKATFDNFFPLLDNGQLYIIEDVAPENVAALSEFLADFGSFFIYTTGVGWAIAVLRKG